MNFRDEWKWIVAVLAVCALVYANSLTGTFVYDDLRQILRNPLIQDNSLIWKALTSDVWAFKGDGTIAASNYWRPTFTAWHILNFRLFGTDPLGWHITNLLLHSGVCVLVYALLRRWAFSAAVAFTITLIFAVHPVHVETVGWISGSPDMLFALAFLGSLWFAQTYAETGRSGHILIAMLLYAVALGAKEIGVVCLPIYYFVLTGDKMAEKTVGNANSAMLMLGAVAAVYFLVRWSLLGAISRPPEDAVRWGTAILSIPSMFAFYLRQIFFPYWVGANYPLEPVSQIGTIDFLVPVIVSLAALVALFYLAKGTANGKLAAALFLLPLATAMNATAFVPEQIVHDRYLYLPLLGMLMLVVPFAAKLVNERQLVIASVVISLALSVQTFRYNRAWANDFALWSWTRSIDNSSFTSMQLASELADSGRYDDATSAYTEAINRRPTARGYLGRGRALIQKRQYKDAERDLTTVIQYPPEKSEAYALYQTYEALGIVYSEQQNYDAAVKNFVAARQALPIYSAALTVNLAIVLYQSGRKEEALRELEGARAQARKEMLPESKSVFFRLGMLYAELGRKDDARAALKEYLTLTSATTADATLEERTQAGKILESLK